jgi:hypothetical protein
LNITLGTLCSPYLEAGLTCQLPTQSSSSFGGSAIDTFRRTAWSYPQTFIMCISLDLAILFLGIYAMGKFIKSYLPPCKLVKIQMSRNRAWVKRIRGIFPNVR